MSSTQNANPSAKNPSAGDSSSSSRSNVRLSYKFQRLRERLREAIAKGELSGKLPGERQLARKYRVNAKTLSKALTDLAAEGLLERTIGRGTFVRGTQRSYQPQAQRWLILCDKERLSSPLIRLLTQQNASVQVVTETTSLRPSFLNTFSAVIDLGLNTPDLFLRDLVVRGLNVLLVGRQSESYSMHGVLFDAPNAAALLTRDLILAGHRHLLMVTPAGSPLIQVVTNSITRYDPRVVMDVVGPQEVPVGVHQGATAIVCDSVPAAAEVRRVLEQASITVPEQVSLCAMGTLEGEPPCDGYFVTPDQEMQAIVQILQHAGPHRPTTLWLAGKQHQVGTCAARLGIDPVQPLGESKIDFTV